MSEIGELFITARVMPMDENLAKEKEAGGARGLAQLSRGLLQGTTRGAAMQWSLFFCCRER
jgi:hypothetical protein